MLRSVSIVAALAALLAAAVPATASAFDYPVTGGGTVRVAPIKDQDRGVRDAIASTIQLEDDSVALPLDPTRCPTNRVVVTVVTRAAIDAAQQAAGSNAKDAAGLFIWAPRPKTDCRILLNARVLHASYGDEAEICDLLEHELGHARGLNHTTTGLMSPKQQFLPVPGYCDWAQSSYLGE